MEGKGDSIKKRLEKNGANSGHLRCFYTNMDSFGNKKHELETRIQSYDPDIVGLTEIKPKNSCIGGFVESDLLLEGYTAYSDMEGRGAVLYVRDGIVSSQMEVRDRGGSSVWCSIPLQGRDNLLVGVVYRSPNSSEAENQRINEVLKEMVNKESSHLLIMGDFNHPDIQWSTQTLGPGAREAARRFLSCCQNCFLSQHVLSPTHYRGLQTANTLDLVLTNEVNMVDNMQYDDPVGKSHHCVLRFDFLGYADRLTTRARKYCYERGDYDKMRKILADVNWGELFLNKDVDQVWSAIEGKLLETVETCVPYVMMDGDGTRKRKPKWMNSNVMAQIRKKKKAFNNYLKSKDGEDYLKYVAARNRAKNELRRAVRKFEYEIAKKAKADPKAFYKYVNNRSKTKPVISNLHGSSGELIQDETGMAEEFNGFFASVFTTEDTSNVPSIVPDPELVKLTKIVFSQNEVYDILKKVKANSSPGPDGIHPRVLKECASEMASPLYDLFAKLFETERIPTAWKTGNITPIHKKGSRVRVENYRPISLTSVVSKCMEKIVRDRLLKHMMDNGILSERQHGFVPGRSCITQLLEVMDLWTEALEGGMTIDAIYLDFAKAFDTVPHMRMIAKLRGYGVDGAILEWIRSFLTERRQRVCIRGAKSSWTEVRSGIPQGTVLGPILFVIYINDLPDVIASYVFMYADDTKIFRVIRDDRDVDLLQRDLDAASEWCRKWLLCFNHGKCKVMEVTGTGGKGQGGIHQYTLKVNGTCAALEKSTAERDLGVTVSGDLVFQGHIEKAVAKALQILGLVKRTLVYFDKDTVRMLYCALVRPHLEYANVIWHPRYKKHVNMLEKVQRKATRLLSGMKLKTYEERLRVLRLPSLVYRRFRGDAIEIYKYTHGLYGTTLRIPIENRPVVKTRGHPLRMMKERVRLDQRANYLFNRMNEAWNRLPEEVVMAPSVNAFKGRFDRYYSDRMQVTNPDQLYISYGEFAVL